MHISTSLPKHLHYRQDSSASKGTAEKSSTGQSVGDWLELDQSTAGRGIECDLGPCCGDSSYSGRGIECGDSSRAGRGIECGDSSRTGLGIECNLDSALAVEPPPQAWAAAGGCLSGRDPESYLLA